MAKVWFVRENPEVTRVESDYEVSIAHCQRELSLSRNHWVSESDPRAGDPSKRLRGIAGKRLVVVEIDRDEARRTGWRQGFYYLDTMSFDEAHRRLRAW